MTATTWPFGTDAKQDDPLTGLRIPVVTDLPAELMTKLHAEALTEDAARRPYCTGDRCTDCTPDEECCEATCGCCPRVSAQDWCWLGSEQDDGSRYCSQHGEGWLNDRTPQAERRYQILRNA